MGMRVATTLLTVAIGILISSCEIYRSTGRKEFESRSPDYITTQAFKGCRVVLEQAASELMNDFSERAFYQSENFWVAEGTLQPHWIEVWNHNRQEICEYRFTNSEEWQNHKYYFLEALE